jgi:DNA-directed RNA polymerase specialized sigma24 family protein
MAPPALQILPGGRGADAADGQAALRDLYGRYGGSVFGRCLYLLKDRTRAEDAMQDVFARALHHHASFRSEASPLR